MTNHTPQELLDAWHTGELYWVDSGARAQLYDFSKGYEGLLEYIIKHPEQFTLTDPNQVEEAVAGEALLDAFFWGTLVRKIDGEAEQLHWSKCDYEKRISALLGIIQHPEWFSIRGTKATANDEIGITVDELKQVLSDCMKPQRPQVGQALTLENLRDVEFMRMVKGTKWDNPITGGYGTYNNFYIDELNFLITALFLGWTVTITEVVEGV